MSLPERVPTHEHPGRVHPLVERAGAYSWRLLAIAAVVVGALWLIGQLTLVVAPTVVAVLVARALAPISGRLRRHRWPPGLAALASMMGAFVVVGGLIALATPSVASEFDSIGPTVDQALDDLEDWIVDDAPVQVSRDSVERLRERVEDGARQLVRSGGDGAVLDRATLVAEVLAGLLLATLLTFFMLRDGERFVAWWCGRATTATGRARRRDAANAAWRALGAFLRGAALLGVVEAVAIGGTAALVGGALVAPIMLFTFFGAFVPVVGATAAGVVAVLVTLVTGGIGAAIIVAVVAVVVQQFDNDLLAPVIYGRALQLHPVVILVSVLAGGALFGLAGTMLAVPVVAVCVSAWREARPVPA